MKKTTINITYDEEKLSALKLYLEQKDLQMENELVKALDILYAKNVPTGVREFIELRSGMIVSPAAKLSRKPKASVSSAVGACNLGE